MPGDKPSTGALGHYRAAQLRARRRDYYFYGIGLCLAMSLATTPWMYDFMAWVGAQLGVTDEEQMNVYVKPAVSLAGLVFYMVVIQWFVYRRHSERCPICRDNLRKLLQYVLATRHCPCCGERLIEDDRLDPETATLPSELDLSILDQRLPRKALPLLAVGIALAIVPALLLDRMEGLIGSPAAYIIETLAVFTAWTMMFFIAKPIALRSCNPPLHNSNFIQSDPNFQTLVNAGRHCPECGQRLLCEPEPPTSEDQRGYTAIRDELKVPAMLKSVRCPHCNKRLHEQAKVVIASHRCPSCLRYVGTREGGKGKSL